MEETRKGGRSHQNSHQASVHPVDKARSEGKRGGGPTTNEILLLTEQKLGWVRKAYPGQLWGESGGL